MEVKIKMTRPQLQELLEKAGCGSGRRDSGKAKRRQVEAVLARADDFRPGVLGGTGGPPCTAYRRPPSRSRDG